MFTRYVDLVKATLSGDLQEAVKVIRCRTAGARQHAGWAKRKWATTCDGHRQQENRGEIHVRKGLTNCATVHDRGGEWRADWASDIDEAVWRLAKGREDEKEEKEERALVGGRAAKKG